MAPDHTSQLKLQHPRAPTAISAWKSAPVLEFRLPLEFNHTVAATQIIVMMMRCIRRNEFERTRKINRFPSDVANQP
ncbi:MAG: hypothetical protein JNN20_00735 [Betaproteobacteria bacterium]|nr:hypothetical protein [Betaproteobacteria bacterium]